jgi:hypothetical protein
MAKKLYVRNNDNTEWVEVANSIQDISNYLTINSASLTYATKENPEFLLSLYQENVIKNNSSAYGASINSWSADFSISGLDPDFINPENYLTTIGKDLSIDSANYPQINGTFTISSVQYDSQGGMADIFRFTFSNWTHANLGDLSLYDMNNGYGNYLIKLIEGSNQTITSEELGYLNNASANIQSQIDSKLSIVSANTTYATKSELENIDLSSASAAAVGYLLDGAPSALNTLNELSAALNDDENFATTVTSSLSNKLNIETASATYATITNLNQKTSTGKAIAMSIVFGS